MESQPGRGEARRPTQPKLPPPPPKSPPCAPQPPPPSRTEQPDPKRRREPKGKEVVETGRTRSSSEEEAHRPTKQLKISNAPSRGLERGEVQQPQPQAWLPAPMLGGEPLTDDASIRDYNGGVGCQVASALRGYCGGQLNPAFKLHWRRPGPISSLICTNSVRKGKAQYPV